MGRIVPEVGDESIREILYRSYCIVCVIDQAADEVEVLTIFHSSRQLGAMGSADE